MKIPILLVRHRVELRANEIEPAGNFSFRGMAGEVKEGLDRNRAGSACEFIV
jgi:hypothetical protein